MSFDYAKYAQQGDYIKFENVGDSVAGIIKEVREGKDFNSNPCPELVLETAEGEEKTVTAGQVLLKSALAEQAPNALDAVKITYSGIGKAQPGKAPAKEFTVEVKRGPFDLKNPAVTNSDAPF